jgi:hypothetical protein
VRGIGAAAPLPAPADTLYHAPFVAQGLEIAAQMAIREANPTHRSNVRAVEPKFGKWFGFRALMEFFEISEAQVERIFYPASYPYSDYTTALEVAERVLDVIDAAAEEAAAHACVASA